MKDKAAEAEASTAMFRNVGDGPTEQRISSSQMKMWNEKLTKTQEEQLKRCNKN